MRSRKHQSAMTCGIQRRLFAVDSDEGPFSTLPGGSTEVASSDQPCPEFQPMFLHFPVAQRWSKHHMSFRRLTIGDAFTAGGVVLLFVGGRMLMTANDGAVLTGLIVSVTGLIGTIGGIGSTFVLPMFKVYLEDRRADKFAKIQRHDMANKLQAALFEIAELKARTTQQEVKIAKVSESGELRSVATNQRVTEMKESLGMGSADPDSESESVTAGGG
jgi:hypothetical protein